MYTNNRNDMNKNVLLCSIVGEIIEEELGLGMIAAYLRQNNITVHIEQFKQPFNNIDFFINRKSLFVCFNTYNTNFNEIIKVCECIKRQLPETIIVLGGSYVSAYSKEILITCNCVDFVIRNEGEITLYELVNCILNNTNSLKDIDGLTYREGKQIFVNKDRDLIENLDTLPLAARDVIINNNINYAAVEGSRGCTSRCSFCSNDKYHKIRLKSICRIVYEMKKIKEELGIDTFSFVDNSFENPGYNITRIKEFCNIINKTNLNPKYFVFMKPGIYKYVDSSFWDLLSTSGLYSILVGIESYVQDDLTIFNKSCTALDNINFMEYMMKYNWKEFQIIAGCIYFHPYVTMESLWTNNKYIHRFKHMQYFPQLHFLRPIKNTPLYDCIIKDKLYIPDEFPYINEIDYKYIDKKVQILSSFIKDKFFMNEKISSRKNNILNYFQGYQKTLHILKRRMKENENLEGASLFEYYLGQMEKLSDDVSYILNKFWNDLFQLVDTRWNESVAVNLLEESLFGHYMDSLIKQIASDKYKSIKQMIRLTKNN